MKEDGRRRREGGGRMKEEGGAGRREEGNKINSTSLGVYQHLHEQLLTLRGVV